MAQEFLQLEEGITPDDPTFRPLQGEIDASPEDEAALGKALASIMEFMYSEEGMAAVVQVMNQDSRQLYEIVPEVGAMLIQKAQSDLQSEGVQINPDVYFGEGGLLQQVPLILFELAEQIGKPGAEDEDQLAAATIGLYKKAGEHVLKSKDENAKQEVMSLGEDVVLAKADGSREDPAKFAERARKSGKSDLKSSIKKGLLGV